MKSPCVLSQDEWDREEEEKSWRKTVNLELVFGYHWKPGTGPKVQQMPKEYLLFDSFVQIRITPTFVC